MLNMYVSALHMHVSATKELSIRSANWSEPQMPFGRRLCSHPSSVAFRNTDESLGTEHSDVHETPLLHSHTPNR